MSYQLTEGVLQTIMRGAEVKDPVLQILGIKKISSGGSEKDRFRLLLSDGKYSISYAILTTQIHNQYGPDGLPVNTVIKVDKFVTSIINNTSQKDSRVLLILDLEVVADGGVVGKKIGNPVAWSEDVAKSEAYKAVGSNNKQAKTEYSSSNGNTSAMSSNENLAGQIIHPIASLSPYQNKWIIKVRVTNKSPIRSWSNSRGEGKLFSLDLLDESGEIRCTGFREAVDKFYEYIQVDKVYFISKCQLKTANKQFSSLKNDYEMTMTNETVIQECEDEDAGIPQVQFNFTTIDKIGQCAVGAIIDVIGICKNASEIQNITAKSTGRELKKKEVTLVDQSNTAISLTLWGAEAENFDGTNNPVVALKGARVGEFNGGKSLSTVSGCALKINPEIPESFRIRGWYDQGGAGEVTNLSAQTGGSGSYKWNSFKEVKVIDGGEKGHYYQTLGTILLMRAENCVYKACPAEECNKKVVDQGNGMYRCEKCNREYPNFKYRLLASMNVGDWSGNQWLTMFSNDAEKILGMTSQEVGEAIEADKDAMVEIAQKVNFKQFIFKCRAKMETYNDENRLKTVAIKIEPINFKDYNTHIIDRIKQLLE